ncbi:MAG: HYR domain-containing protein, partial [Gaiellaceae bacterium]
IVYDIGTNTLTRTNGGSWLSDGFKKGQQVTIGPLAGTWNVVDVTAAVLTLNGPQLTPYPNVSYLVKAISQYVGIVKAVTQTTITLNLALSLADFPNGPDFQPVVGQVTRDLRVLNRVGNSAPFFVFPLANPYLYSGNDVVDAHLLDWADATNALRSVGLTVYGGPGDDLIIGSQTGDHLAGGSGDDTILGQRGEDHIYGDSGFNVDLITRLLDVATVGTGPAGYAAAKFKNKDGLVAGNDLLYGEGVGSATFATPTATAGNDDDIIFGDLGVVSQYVAGPRDVTKALPSQPQKLQTTLLTPALGSDGVSAIDSQALQNAGNDWIYGNADRDILIGGAGDDAIDGGIQDDLIFGDNVELDRTVGDTTSPRFQTLTGTLLYSRSDLTPGATADTSGVLLADGTARRFRDADDVPWWAEYDVMQLWHDFNADPSQPIAPTHWAGSFGNDYIAGNQGNDMAFGELGDDTIQGDGSIDYVAHRLISDTTAANGTVDPAYNVALLGRVAAYRTPGGVTDPVGALTLYPSFEASTDGEDYIEGGGGRDLIFGGLGQDDVVGGSSSFFSLVSNDQRPDSGDAVFGGAGARTHRAADTTFASLALTHARDADTVAGDNADIVRIVGFGGVDVATGKNLSLASTPRYVSFVYDNYVCAAGQATCVTPYDANTKLVVRGVTLRDYTAGGPDFQPALFNTNTGNCANGSPASGPCSNVISSCTGTGGASSKYVDIGGRDEVHGEAGDDTVYGECGDDTIYGDAQDDDLYGNWGQDWISGGTGQDGILGDDGRIFTSRNSGFGYTWTNATASWTQSGCENKTAADYDTANCLTEPLFGIRALLRNDPDTKTAQGNVLSEFTYTPGHVQEATINIATRLAKAVDLTPFNDTPAPNGDNPLYDANNSDDVIFGGWDDDFMHGGSGDDAMMGGEALGKSYIQRYDDSGTCTQTQTNQCVLGLVETDWYHPWNPGDILHFGADTNPWLDNHHIAQRLGEFLLYDEYDPRRTILFQPDGTVWHCLAVSNSGHTCTDTGGAAPVNGQYFLNFDRNDGRTTPPGCVSFDPNGTCNKPFETRKSDGNDAIFGDLGNDWLVGGTSNNDAAPAGWPAAVPWVVKGDTLWGGWGNDLMNADDDLAAGCVSAANNGTCLQYGDTWLNDIPDTHPSYEDRVFGGAGLDVLIGNTGGDRLIDWVGEFNSYLVPFSPFGIATVSRQVEPQLPEFLYALSHSQGADPTRAEDSAALKPRYGEPNGEIGLVTQQDHGIWQTQTGSPSDPQAGNIPGGRRDVLRSADLNDGKMQGFAVDSGVWQVSGGALSVAAGSLGQDAAAVLYVDQYLPTYYELLASVQVTKPTAGWNANAYVIFDYFSPTDFKFAGIDVSLNKVVLGHRTAQGWVYDAQGTVRGSLAAGVYYDVQVIVNGLVVSVLVNGSSVLTQQLDPRWIDGTPNGFNLGLVGVGSNNSRGVYDNIAVQVLPPQSTFASTEDYADGVADLFTGAKTGTWLASSGRYAGTATSSGGAIAMVKAPVNVTPEAYLEWETVLRSGGGLVFDYYSAEDYKYVTLDVTAGTVTIGHRIKGRLVTDLTVAATMAAGVDQKLTLALSGTGVTVSLNGTQLTTYTFYGNVVDGGLGLLVRSGTVSFDNTRVQIGTRVINALDNTPPTLAIPVDVTRATDPGKATASIGDSTIGSATASDNVAISSITLAGVPAGNLFGIGTTTLTWTATDIFGNKTVKTQKITVVDVERPVLNVPASVSVTVSGAQSSIVVGDAQLGTATATDNAGAVTIVRSGVPAGNIFPVGKTTITYTATDASGNVTTGTQTVTVARPGVVLTAGPSQASSEGATATFNLGSFSGGTGPYTVTVEWGDGAKATFAAAPGALSAAHAYQNDRATPYAVKVTVTDAAGTTATGSFSVTVANAAPALTIGAPASGKVFATGSTVSLSASFTDAGTADTHTCTIAWGNGASSAGTVTESGGAGTCTGSNVYRQTGNYSITVTVVDSSGAATTKTVAISVTKSGTIASSLYGAGTTAVSSSLVSMRWLVRPGSALRAQRTAGLLWKSAAKRIAHLAAPAR